MPPKEARLLRGGSVRFRVGLFAFLVSLFPQRSFSAWQPRNARWIAAPAAASCSHRYGAASPWRTVRRALEDDLDSHPARLPQVAVLIPLNAVTRGLHTTTASFAVLLHVVGQLLPSGSLLSLLCRCFGGCLWSG